MELIDIIRERRSIGKVTSELPPCEQIKAMLEAATWAPNHFKVEPWRFFVLTGAGRERLGAVLAKAVLDEHDDPESKAAKDAAERARAVPLRAPVVIAVAAEHPEDPRVIAVENVSATAAAVQNMLLVAHSFGLGAMWRTGNPAYRPQVKEFFGLEPDAAIVGYVYVGLPAMEPPLGRRTPFAEKTVWWGDQESEYSHPATGA